MIIMLIGFSIGLGIYFYFKNKDDGPSTGPQPPSVAKDPRSTTWAKGQKICTKPVEIVKNVTAVKKLPVQPKLPATVVYSLSFDIYLEAYDNENMGEILSSGSGDSQQTDGTLVQDVNQPLIAIGMTKPSYSHQKQLMVRHIDDTVLTDVNGDEGHGTTGVSRADTTIIPLKKWTNVIVRIDGINKKQETYINGDLGGVGTFTRTPTWAKTKNNWTFGTVWNYGKNYGSIQIANMYFFDKYIDDKDIPKLKIPARPIASVDSTKY